MIGDAACRTQLVQGGGGRPHFSERLEIRVSGYPGGIVAAVSNPLTRIVRSAIDGNMLPPTEWGPMAGAEPRCGNQLPSSLAAACWWWAQAIVPMPLRTRANPTTCTQWNGSRSRR